MSNDIRVQVYYGPLSWFRSETESQDCEYLLDIVNELDDSRRKIVHVMEGQNSVPQGSENEVDEARPECVVVESSDYASLQEHAIMNFVGLVRPINPELLILHNPPAHIERQLRRELEITVSYFQYPAITRATLQDFATGFAERIVGQNVVREEMLASMYPLLKKTRNQPVVIMLYGPSGVGKTQTAQFINELLGGTLFRKQFSMFNNDRFASYLFGGSHSEASFARDLLDRESGVILIDEFDKANRVFHSAFYELFDGGRFEDRNYVVEVGASLIICTSNYNSLSDIRSALGEALYSRFDALIQFRPLSVDEVRQVMDRLIDKNLRGLDADERLRLDATKLRISLDELPSKLGNIRQLGKLVEQTTSLMLVRSLLGGSSSDGTHDDPTPRQ